MARHSIHTYFKRSLIPLIVYSLCAAQQPSVQPSQPQFFAPDVTLQQAQQFPFLSSDAPMLADAAAQTDIKPVTGEVQQQTTPDATKEKDEPANIYLNFDNVALASIVNYMGEQKKVNLLPHKDLEGVKISLSTRKPLTLERAWNVMLTLLEMNGFSIIKVTTKKGGDLYRVVSNRENGQVPLPAYSSATGTEPEALPDQDIVIRYIYFFKNIKAEMAQGFLSKMLDDGSIILNNNLNALIIKEKSMNIKAAMRVAKELDEGGLRETIEMIPLTWANSDTVAQLLQTVAGSTAEDSKTIKFNTLGQNENTYFSSSTKIFSEPVKNMIILLGNKKNIDRIREFIYKSIDVPIDTAESRLHIKEVKHAKAEDIAPLLTDIIAVRTSSDKAAVAEGGYKVFENVIITSEKGEVDQQTGRGGGNRLIVACNKDDWKRLEEFIEKIDKPQPQVAIEVMLINVDTNQYKELGAQEWGLKGKMPRGLNPTNGLEFFTLSSTKGAGTGTSNYLQYAQDATANPTAGLGDYATFFATLGNPASGAGGGTNNIWSIIRGRFALNNTHVISQPSVVVNNNQKCTVNIASDQLADGPLDQQKGGVLPCVTKVRVTATNSVELTPRINYSGVIDLSINVQLEEFTGGTTNKVTRKLTTKASMGTGEVLVLGGLTSSNLKEVLYKIPILGDIPIIGNLFRSKSKTKSESNLYVFIRPSIIRPRFEGNPDEYTQLKLDYAKYQIMRNDSYATEKDPVQRWFFKPTNTSIKQKLADYAQGILRPIDNYAYGMYQPKSVNIQEDPYFKGRDDLERFKRRKDARRQRETEMAAAQGAAPELSTSEVMGKPETAVLAG